MNLKDQIKQFRDDSLVQDEGDLPDNSIIDLLNRAGQQLIDMDAYAIERRYSQASVAARSYYVLPADFYDFRLLVVNNSLRISKVDIDIITNDRIGTRAIGDSYTYGFWGNELFLQVPPGSDGATTTLNGSITASSSSISIVTPSGMVNRGCILIDSEKIYFDTATASGSNTTLSNIQRGREDTAAAAHSDGATVTLLNIEMWYYARYRKHLKAPELGRGDPVTSGGNLDVGRHYLLWTYYDNVRGLESYPRDLYSITTQASYYIALRSLVDAPDLKSYQKRIYMTRVGYTQPFYLVTTLEAGTTSYNVDMVDSVLLTKAEFDWDNIGGGNMPDELRDAQVDKAIALYLRPRKRHNEADRYEISATNKFLMGIRAIKGRRTVAAKSRRPDIVL